MILIHQSKSSFSDHTQALRIKPFHWWISILLFIWLMDFCLSTCLKGDQFFDLCSEKFLEELLLFLIRNCLHFQWSKTETLTLLMKQSWSFSIFHKGSPPSFCSHRSSKLTNKRTITSIAFQSQVTTLHPTHHQWS